MLRLSDFKQEHEQQEAFLLASTPPTWSVVLQIPAE